MGPLGSSWVLLGLVGVLSLLPRTSQATSRGYSLGHILGGRRGFWFALGIHDYIRGLAARSPGSNPNPSLLFFTLFIFLRHQNLPIGIFWVVESNFRV